MMKKMGKMSKMMAKWAAAAGDVAKVIVALPTAENS